MLNKKIIYTALLSLFLTSANSADVIDNKINQKINELSDKTAEAITNFAENNFKNMKYLDFDIQVQEKLKPTFSIMSVSELLKIDSGTIFNQTSLNYTTLIKNMNYE